MGRAIIGYGAGLGLLTLAGLLLGIEGSGSQAITQFNLFIVLLKAYTPLLTPFSSILGYPILGGSQSLGPLPLLIWIAIGCLLGILLRSGGGAAKAMFLTSATILILWIGSLFFSAPAWPDQRSWLMAISNLSNDLISRPIDLGFILLGPMLVSAIIGQLTGEISSRLVQEKELEERYRLY